MIFLLLTLALAALPAERIDAVFADLGTNSTGSPGCALAVAQDGKIVYERGYGTADLEHGVPISPRTVFDTGSIAKMFTAASVFLLEEQGKLSLDDSIRKHVPELPGLYQAVTLRHLIHHTGGVRDHLFLRELAGYPDTEPVKPGEVIALLARQKGLDFPPGKLQLRLRPARGGRGEGKRQASEPVRRGELLQAARNDEHPLFRRPDKDHPEPGKATPSAASR